MRWIKHFTNASDGEFLSWLIDQYGLEGYARWWIILEKIGARMDKSDCCSASYSLEKWSSFLRQKQNKMKTFLEQIENKSKIFLELNGNILTIKVPNLLKYKDNYSKDLEATSKKLPSKEVEVDIDKEEKKINKEKSPLKKKKQKRISALTPERLIQFERWYNLYPKKVGRAEAEQEWLALDPDIEFVDKMIIALKQQIINGSFSDDPHYILHPCRWIKQKRWTDGINIKEAENGHIFI